MEQFRSAARKYAGFGWRVFPLLVKSKWPATPHGFKDGTTDTGIIDGHWIRNRSFNVGVATGKASGVVVVDIDPRNGGDATWLALLAEHGAPPPTLTVRSGAGGTHYYFAYPEGVDDLRSGSDKLGRGIDFKAEGGYIVAPPSIHDETGQEYRWEMTGAEVVAPLPKWILDATRSAKVLQLAPTISGDITEGGRNAALTSLAGTMRRRGMGADSIEAALQTENQARCNPPLPQREVSSIAHSISRYAPAEAIKVEISGVATEDEPFDPFAEHSKRFTVEELREPPPRQEFLWGTYIPAGLVTIFAGPGGVSKTTALTQVAVARAHGTPLFGAQCRRGKTVILTTEDGATDYRRKLFTLSHEMEGFDAQTVADSLLFLDCSGVPMRLVELDKGNWYPTPVPDQLAAHIKKAIPDADLVIMETVSRLAGGQETNESLSILVESAQRVCRLTGAAVVLVAHVSQEAARQGNADAYAARGGSALGDNGRSTIVLTFINHNNRKKFLPGAELSDADMKRLAVLSHAKANGGAMQEPIILERVRSDWGSPYLRPYDVPEPSGPSQAQRVATVVEKLHARDMCVTRRKLRDHLDELGVPLHHLNAAVNQAIEEGLLLEVERAGKGPPGFRLVPSSPAEQLVQRIGSEKYDLEP